MNRLGSRLAGAALIASAAAVVVASGTASAMFHRRPDLSSGDARATAHPNRRFFDLDCRRAGLAGSRTGVTAFTDDGRTHLTVTSVPTGVDVTGLVVQGVLAYNVYPRSRLGVLPFQRLRAPDRPGGRPGPVLRWFACGGAAPSAELTPTRTAHPTSAPAPTAAGRPAPTAAPRAGGDGSNEPDEPDGSQAEGTLGPAAPQAGVPTPTAGLSTAGATLGGPAVTSPPAGRSVGLRDAARVDLGAPLYLAVALLLLVAGGLLMVAPRPFAPLVAWLRRRD
ncbi:MAG TPA: hypothetical protein VFX70_08420 [Mycobacteriales bacterium]|nr:hypothetical protein [Mycobacteriales bacterium]